MRLSAVKFMGFARPAWVFPTWRFVDARKTKGEYGNGPERSERIRLLFATFSVFDFFLSKTERILSMFHEFLYSQTCTAARL